MTEQTIAAGCPIPPESLGAVVDKHAGSKAPAPLKLMTARGMAPMPPKDLVSAQFVLTFDADEKVRDAAEKSLSSLDARIANAILGDHSLNPHVLGYLAERVATNDTYAEKILLNTATPSSAFVPVARVCTERVAELIAQNQARVLEEPEILRALTENPAALKSTVDRTVDFLIRSGVVLEGLKEFEDALLRLNGEDRLKAAEAVELPKHLLDEKFLSDEDKEELSRERQLIEEDEEELTEEKEKNLETLLRSMNAAQKVALATKGNKSARAILMRDTNRLVALAAITSPAVTEMEVIAAAQSRSVHADVISHIARDKRNNWVRIYQVKLALVNNPKAPLAESMRLVPMLNARDLKIVARSKNVSAGIRNLAGKLVKGQADRKH